ncbi:MAG: MipA/OmpV family protein [Kiritimatiellia bacterium]
MKRGRANFPCLLFVLAGALGLLPASAAELTIGVINPPATGAVVVLLFGSAAAFADLRDPVKTVALPAGGNTARIPDLPAGEYALAVFVDENGNGRLDRNFVGIPREPLGFSNRYRAKGPPAFSRASFRLGEAETESCDVELQAILGKRGMIGAGVGVLAQTSPYRDSDSGVVRPIPALTYIGDRFQILGPFAQCGIVNGADVSLAATARYRVGAYEESDSAYLEGLGDRRDTLMGGLAVQGKLPAGFRLSLGYENDVLGRTDGGAGRLGLRRAFQHGVLSISPHLALNWLSADLADYEYGVPADRVREGRPAYRPGAAINSEIGVSLFVELSRDWRIILNGSATFLPAEITDSPIVERAQVFGCFGAVNRLF